MTVVTPAKQDLFREAASLFASGVTILTSSARGRAHGVTVSAFASLSLEPSMVLACVNHRSRVLPLVRESGAFGVSVLAEEQEGIARALADSSRAVGEGLDGLTLPGRYTGVPILRDCLSYFECTLREEVVGGDHAILVGHVEEAGRGGGAGPLLFFNRQFRRLA